MAKGSLMLQIDVLQESDEAVTSIPPLIVSVFDFLSFGKTTVREITAQKTGGVIVSATGNTIGFSEIPDAELKLFLAGGKEISLFAPSHVSSPQFEAGFVILELNDTGVSAIGDDLKIGVSRRIGGHAYLEEIA
jgi:hypothetical protein